MNAATSSAYRAFPRLVAAAFLTTLLHLAVLIVGPMAGGTPRERYHRLVQHDSYWFMDIIGRGYQSPVPPSPVKRMEVSNVAFFPGYPLLAGAFVHGLGLYPWTALPLASQLATWGFWTYFLLLARELRFSRAQTIAATALVAAHPAAFYLIAGYSESLFLLFVLGYLFWSARSGAGAAFVAALHGAGMTATRIAGAPAAFAPLLRALTQRAGPYSWRGWSRAPRDAAAVRAALLGVASLVGMIAFFAYCQTRWGHWDFYMMTQEAGWGVRPDYLALLKPGAYLRWWPDWSRAAPFGQFLTTLTTLAYVGLAAWEITAARRGPTRWRERLPLHFTGFALYALAVSGVYSVRLESMTRYQFCAHVLLVLGVLHAYLEIGPARPATRRLLIAAVVVAALFGLVVQMRFAAQFARAEWVA